MDWNAYIERNRGELLPVVLGLFAMIGLAEGAMVERLSRPLYRKALRILRSAESAVRRLIVVMARDIVVEPRKSRPAPKGFVRPGRDEDKAASQDQSQREPRPPSFQLCDPEKRSDAGKVRRRRRKGRRSEPHIHVFHPSNPNIPWFLRGRPAPPPPPRQVAIVEDYTVSARRLCRRIFALMSALNDLPRQAKRLALWQAKPVDERRPRRERALRFGRPPGWRNKSIHAVDDILKECHWLFHELPKLDTS